MNSFFCDSHAHLTSSELYNDLEGVLARAQQAHLKKIINIATDESSLKKGLELSLQHDWIFNAAAVHPHNAEKLGAEFLPVVAEYARNGRLCAVGETGLDYYYTHSTADVQKEVLRKHLHLALETKLPVIIHCRNAFADFFKVLDEEYVVNGQYGPGVLHCFTGTLEDAQEALKRGFYISFSGIVTFKKSVELHEVAKIVPLDKMLVETDAPYLAPQSKRGKPNEPSYVVETTEFLANLRGLSVPDMAKATYTNMCTLFKL